MRSGTQGVRRQRPAVVARASDQRTIAGLRACNTSMTEQLAQPDAISRSTKGAKMAGNTQFLQGLYEAFAKGDAPTVLGAMAPGIEWNGTLPTARSRSSS